MLHAQASQTPEGASYPPPPGYYPVPAAGAARPLPVTNAESAAAAGADAGDGLSANGVAALHAEMARLRAELGRQQAVLDQTREQLEQARAQLEDTQSAAQQRDQACVARIDRLTQALANLRSLEARLASVEKAAADIDLGALEAQQRRGAAGSSTVDAGQVEGRAADSDVTPATGTGGAQPETADQSVTRRDSDTGSTLEKTDGGSGADQVGGGGVKAPTADADNDGVADAADLCPSLPGAKVDATGCLPAQTLVLEGVNFRYDSHQLTAGAQRVLDRVISVLRQHPDLRLEVAGHADAQGDPVYNEWLSQLRANSVRDYLLQHGFDPAHISARGYGSSQPLASNDTRAGLRSNRRVELRRLP